MTITPRVLEPQCEWTAADVADEALWTEHFDDAEQAELDAALRHALSKSDDVLEHRTRRLPAPDAASPARRASRTSSSTAAASCACAASTEARTRRPRWRSSTGASACTSGCRGPQNKHGHVLGDVTDQNKATNDPTARGNELGGVALPFHCDGSDLVGLMCLENGLSGGLSAVANSVAHPQPARGRSARPRRRAVRTRCPTTSAASKRRAASRTTHSRSSPSGTAGCSCAASRRTSTRRSATPTRRDSPTCSRRRWTTVVRMADDPENHVLMELLPGDMQFINNYHVLHGRTAYEDDRGAGRIRHLKRLWLETTVLPSRPAVLRQQPVALVREAHRQPHAGRLTFVDAIAGQTRRDRGLGGGIAGDARVHHDPRFGQVPLARAVQDAAVVPHHDIARLPSMPVRRAAAGTRRRVARSATRSDSSGSSPGMACACRPMNSAGRPVTGCTFTSGRNCGGSSMP